MLSLAGMAEPAGFDTADRLQWPGGDSERPPSKDAPMFHGQEVRIPVVVIVVWTTYIHFDLRNCQSHSIESTSD